MTKALAMTLRGFFWRGAIFGGFGCIGLTPILRESQKHRREPLKVQEKNLQRKLLTYAKANGILAVKVDSSSMRGWPDLVVILPNGTSLYIEVKTPSGRLSKLQQIAISKIEQQGAAVYVIRTIDEFCEVIARHSDQ